MLTSDAGNTGTGGPRPTATRWRSPSTAANDAPVKHGAGRAELSAEDTNLSLTGLSISDVDAGSATITTTLSVLNGTADGVVGAGLR